MLYDILCKKTYYIWQIKFFYKFATTKTYKSKATAMKRIFFYLFVIVIPLFAFGGITATYSQVQEKSPADDYQRLVVEGRTWWYTSIYEPATKDVEFGVRIDEVENIDGVEWHKVELVGARYSDLQCNYTYVTNPLMLIYIREEDHKVYTLVNSDCQYKSFQPFSDCKYGIWSDDNSPVLIYSFSNIGDSFEIYTELKNLSFEITDIEDVEISGYSFKRYMLSEVVAPDEVPVNRFPLTMVEGIGLLKKNNAPQNFSSLLLLTGL